jgi:hypothetical protein
LPVAITAAQGTVALEQQIAALEIAYAFGRERAAVFPLVSIGGGAYHLKVDGTAKKPYVGEHHDVGAGFVCASAGVGVRLREGIALLADAGLLVLQPKLIVTIAGVAAGSIGRPAIVASAGLVLRP